MECEILGGLISKISAENSENGYIHEFEQNFTKKYYWLLYKVAKPLLRKCSISHD